MNDPAPFQIGFNARLFPNNWRPVSDEFAFAVAHHFQALQIRRDDAAIDEAQLGVSFSEVAQLVRATALTVNIELVIRVNERGETLHGSTPLDILSANLPAIQALACHLVHWHLVPTADVAASRIPYLENALVTTFTEGVAYAHAHNFDLGFEHNEPDLLLFGTPESCKALLSRVPDLKFVWDFNHTIPDHVRGFWELIPYMRVLHVSDTPLPEVNYHLPLGLGTVDYAEYCRVLATGGFCGPAILEIGGLPKSGGMGRDTDDALIDSYQRWQAGISHAH